MTIIVMWFLIEEIQKNTKAKNKSKASFHSLLILLPTCHNFFRQDASLLYIDFPITVK